MTEQQFDERLKEIERHYSGLREGADAYRDQEVSRLFVECGWTQEKIGRRMGQSKSWVCRRLLFGRFLEKLPTGQLSFSPAKPLTERRFRDHWSLSARGKHPKETEDERFARVLELLKEDRRDTPKNYSNLVKKPGITKFVIEVCSDGKRRTSEEIANIVSETIPDVGREQVTDAIRRIQKKPPKDMALDARHTGRTHKYRLVPRKKSAISVPAAVCAEEVGVMAAEAIPLVQECIKILKAPIVGRQTTLALEHLWRVEKMLATLLVPEEVV